MATVKVKLRPSSVEGKASVIYYQITHNRKTRQITTKLRVSPSDWDSDEEKMVIPAPNRSMIQNRIDSDVALLRRVILDLDNCGVDYSVSDIINRYKSPQSHILVLDYMRTQVEQLRATNRLGTAKNYEKTMCSFGEFLGDVRLPLSALTEQVISNDLENRRFDRDQVSEQLRARSLTATVLLKTEIDKMERIAKIKADDEISDAEWEATRKQKGREAEGWDLDAIIYGRKYVLERQQLVDEVEKRRLQNDANAEEIKGRQQQDDYETGKKLKEHDVEEKIKEDEYQRQLRENEDALKRLQQMLDMEQNVADRETRRKLEEERARIELELNKSKEQHAFELEQEKIKAEKEIAIAETESKMTGDQLVAKNIASMDAVAQAKFAESFSHLNELELTKMNAAEQAKLYQQMIDMAKDNGANIQKISSDNAAQQMEMMKQVLATMAQMSASQTLGQQGLVNSMVGAIQGVANGKIQDAEALKNEYKEEKHHAEARLDETQKQSLNATTRVKMSENMPNMLGGTSVNVHVGATTCPVCGQSIDDKDMLCCPVCGQDLK